MLTSAIRRLSLLATLGLVIWLIARFRADQRAAAAIATPWPKVPVDPEAAPPAAEPIAEEPKVDEPRERKPRAQSVALRRPSEVISMALPTTEDVPATTGPNAWAEPVDGACPPGYPVKAKLTSHLYHEAGMLAYTRTRPDRCYPDGATAEKDGFVRAKR